MVEIRALSPDKFKLVVATLSLNGIDWEQEDSYTVRANCSMPRVMQMLKGIPRLEGGLFEV